MLLVHRLGGIAHVEEFPPAAIDAGLRAAIAAEDPEIAYVPSSNGGVVSGSGPWHWGEPATYTDPDLYKAGVLGFHTEIGMPVIPHAETIRNLVGDEPEWPISEVWAYHDWAWKGNQHVDRYQKAIEDRLGVAGSLDEFTRRAPAHPGRPRHLAGPRGQPHPGGAVRGHGHRPLLRPLRPAARPDPDPEAHRRALLNHTRVPGPSRRRFSTSSRTPGAARQPQAAHLREHVLALRHPGRHACVDEDAAYPADCFL
ncbi:hypothetical protein GCM10010435_83370 [Winogradskya consettensis]|uniref:Uncharacterized protein n=1 Tax=Winogradskya consettensis TaxID=113560 RepID=A0A919T030_9ACTN|nr:hypothetical protein Aco04nite_80730 [Actinoplanes consettensis]